MNSTMGLYYHTLEPAGRVKAVIEILSASEEYKNIPMRYVNDTITCNYGCNIFTPLLERLMKNWRRSPSVFQTTTNLRKSQGLFLYSFVSFFISCYFILY